MKDQLAAYEEGLKKAGTKAASFAAEVKKKEVVLTDYYPPMYLIEKLSFMEEELKEWQKARSLRKFGFYPFSIFREG